MALFLSWQSVSSVEKYSLPTQVHTDQLRRACVSMCVQVHVLYMCQGVLPMGGRVGVRLSFKEMIGELEREELEGQKATSKTSASPLHNSSLFCPHVTNSLMETL